MARSKTKAKRGAGRPRKEVGFDEVESLAAVHLPLSDIATLLNLSEDTLRRRGVDFAVKTGRAKLRYAIRAGMLRKATAGRGDTKMLIHMDLRFVKPAEPAEEQAPVKELVVRCIRPEELTSSTPPGPANPDSTPAAPAGRPSPVQ